MDMLAGGAPPGGAPPPMPPPPDPAAASQGALSQGAPPDPALLAAITGGGGFGGPDAGAPAPADAGPPPPSQPQPEGGGGGPGDETSMLKDLIEQGKAYMDIPTVEHSERSQMMKALTIFQTLLASNQKMSDQATGATPQNRKLLGGGAA